MNDLPIGVLGAIALFLWMALWICIALLSAILAFSIRKVATLWANTDVQASINKTVHMDNWNYLIASFTVLFLLFLAVS